MPIKLLQKKKPGYVMPAGLKKLADNGGALVHVQKKPAKKAVVVAPPVVVAPAPVVQPQVQTSANVQTSAGAGGKAEVTITMALKGESPAYLEIEINGKQAWLAKTSLVRFSVSNGQVRFTMTRQQAQRRGLLDKAEDQAA
jgi:hypothetical protein